LRIFTEIFVPAAPQRR